MSIEGDIALASEQESLGGASSYEMVPEGAAADLLDSSSSVVIPSMSELEELKEEPDSLRKWKAEQAEIIAERDREAEVRRQEWKAEAAKELECWRAKQDEVLQKKKEGNREAQADMLRDIQEEKPGQQWERICKLCDFNPKNNHNTKDTARMRSLFLQLKQSPLVR